ncbi:MAG TPA: hypothetical protein VNN74_06750 [Candidatus Micrarchaeia archaeon]|nr:hypothetical protein [Candidatus Micrarchaeia archaeon]
MTRDELAPGLTVDWLNAWLAALGVAILLPGVRLSWTRTPVPAACFARSDGSPPLAEALAAALPSVGALDTLAIARSRPPAQEFSRTVRLDVYAERAALARASRDWSLSSTVTDLVAPPPADGLPDAPFNPPVPQGRTLWERAVSCRRAIVDPAADITATLAGDGRRRVNNGLGFDVRRLAAGVQNTDKRVDPVVELLAFCALGLFPMRGNGAKVPRARGWTGPPGRPGSFRWCAWSPALDRWAIDALLDVLPDARGHPDFADRLGILTWYHTVPYRSKSENDMTRAYGAECEP